MLLPVVSQNQQKFYTVITTLGWLVYSVCYQC